MKGVFVCLWVALIAFAIFSDDVFAQSLCDDVTPPNALNQCAWIDSSMLPPYAYDAIVSQGGNGSLLNGSCGNILILSSGNPLDNDNILSTNMSNDGCGLNPDGFPTFDCVTLSGFSALSDSSLVAISSEWPEFQFTTFTDWMMIQSGLVQVNISINNWTNVSLLPQYGPSSSGSVTLATLAASSSVDFRVADSGDAIYDTALIAVPNSCGNFGSGLLCGNGIIDPGEQCDGGNLGGQTCQSLGFGGGTLGCTNTCLFDTNSCFLNTSGSIGNITVFNDSTSSKTIVNNLSGSYNSSTFYIRLPKFSIISIAKINLTEVSQNFKNIVDVADTYLDINAPGTNFGGDTVLTAGENNYITLMKFDLTSFTGNCIVAQIMP